MCGLEHVNIHTCARAHTGQLEEAEVFGMKASALLTPLLPLPFSKWLRRNVAVMGIKGLAPGPAQPTGISKPSKKQLPALLLFAKQQQHYLLWHPATAAEQCNWGQHLPWIIWRERKGGRRRRRKERILERFVLLKRVANLDACTNMVREECL